MHAENVEPLGKTSLSILHPPPNSRVGGGEVIANLRKPVENYQFREIDRKTKTTSGMWNPANPYKTSGIQQVGGVML